MTTPVTAGRLTAHAVLAELRQEAKMERARQVFDDDLIDDLSSPQARRLAVEIH